MKTDSTSKVYAGAFAKINRRVEDRLTELGNDLMGSDKGKKGITPLVNKCKEDILADISEKFFQLLFSMEQEKLEAEVITATPLSEEDVVRLENKLTRVAGKRVFLKTTVDKEILGGIKINIGGRVLDGSLQRRLNEMHKDLVEKTVVN